jgi:serine/threonine protein kinase
MPNHFLAAGVYGCVYYPGYTCKGSPMKKKSWVSKLTYSNERTQAEIEIGKILQKVPRYQEHFVVVDRACPIASTSLTQMKEGCDLIKKNKSYVLLYSLYIPSMELYDYLQSNTLVIRVIRCFFKICESIEVLVEQRIVHHDLHFSNMLRSSASQILLIDFGLSMVVDHFGKSKYLEEVFSRYMPEWNWYTLEIHLLTYLIHHGPLTEHSVKNTIDDYLEKHSVFTLFPWIRTQFRKDAIDYFLSMVEWSREECIEHLLTFWDTWDYYETALRFLYLYAEQKMDYPTYLEHLVSMIHANPEKRPNVLELRNRQKKVIQSFDLDQSHSAYSSIDAVLLESLENKYKIDRV